MAETGVHMGGSSTTSVHPAAPPIEKADSEYECELMIEALKKELSAVRNQLAYLTHHLDSENVFQHEQFGPTRELGSNATPSPLSKSIDVASTNRGGNLATLSQVQATGTLMASAKELSGQRTKLKKTNRKLGGLSETEEREQHLHYLQVVDQAEKRSWEARKRCLVLMQEHIERQLKFLQERAIKFQKKLAKIKRREKAERLKLKPPRFKSSGVDDTSFLAKVHQSMFYKIVGIEHELRADGKLRTIADLKEFWDHMLTPTQSSSTQLTSSHQPRPPSTTFALEEEDEEEEDYSDSWAITALPPQRSYSPKRSPLRVRTATPITPSTPDSLRFIPMKIPQFKAVADILGEDTPKHKAKRMDSEYDCRDRSRELEVERRTLQHMYQQARAHEVLMQRRLPEIPCFERSQILAREDDEKEEEERVATTLQQEEEEVCSAAGGLELYEETAERTEQMADKSTVVELPRSALDVTASSQSSDKPDEIDEEGLTHYQSLSPARQASDTSALSMPVMMPLTMDTAMDHFPVRESRCKSTLWTNYLMARGCS